jgi:hypothetical protein
LEHFPQGYFTGPGLVEMSPHSKIILIIDVYERTPINSFDYQYSEQITHIRLYATPFLILKM